MILVEVYIPAMDEYSDFMLDEHAQIKKIIEELGEMLSKKMKSTLNEGEEQFMLCLLERNEVLSGEKTLAECHVKNGSKLLLV